VGLGRPADDAALAWQTLEGSARWLEGADVSDIKLFRIDGGVTELAGGSMTVEKSLQELFETNLESLLGVRFLAREYSTGKTHGGRIDTLGIDENNCPVIIEYKRSLNENVINQGLFYLDWLLDHQAEFVLLANRVLQTDHEDLVDWSAPRLVCVAGDFNRYDEHAVGQINRSIELLRYRHYDDGFLILELVNAARSPASAKSNGSGPVGKATKTVKQSYRTVEELLAQASTVLKDLYGELDAFLVALGDDVSTKTLKLYFAYRRIKNFACVEVHPVSKEILVYVKVNPDSLELVEGFTRDVRSIGHFGTGDLEIRLRGSADLEAAKALLVTSYEGA